MDKLGKDILFVLSTKLDFPELLKFCQSNKRINDLVYERDDIWLHKLRKEYPNWKEFKFNLSMKKSYIKLYQLEKLREKLNLEYSLLDLYNKKELDYQIKEIKEIPKEIGQLQNLQYINLSHNEIKEIPKEIGYLRKLETLYLYNNEIKEIPKEIGQLSELEFLDITNNQLKKIPKEIGQLRKLKEISLSFNQINKILKEIGQLDELIYIEINNY